MIDPIESQLKNEIIRITRIELLWLIKNNKFDTTLKDVFSLQLGKEYSYGNIRLRFSAQSIDSEWLEFVVIR